MTSRHRHSKGSVSPECFLRATLFPAPAAQAQNSVRTRHDSQEAYSYPSVTPNSLSLSPPRLTASVLVASRQDPLLATSYTWKPPARARSPTAFVRPPLHAMEGAATLQQPGFPSTTGVALSVPSPVPPDGAIGKHVAVWHLPRASCQRVPYIRLGGIGFENANRGAPVLLVGQLASRWP